MARKIAPGPVTDDLDSTLEQVALADVRPHPRNDGTHPPEEIAHLRASLQAHGVYRNPVIAQDGTLLAGHGVVQAAVELGFTHLSMKRLPYESDDPRALQLLVGDNHIARLRFQDDATLVTLLEDLQKHDPLALLGTGFDEASLQALLAAQQVSFTTGEPPGPTEHPGRDVEPEIRRADELREQWGVELGQLWACGAHRIIVGDCTDKAVVERLLHGTQAILCHADPPYGMGKEADGIANDNLYASKLDAFQMRWWTAARPFLADNASVYVWGNAEDLWRLWYVGGLRDSERLTLRNELVWDKGDSGAGVVSLQGADGLRMFPPGSERCLFFMLGEQGFSTNADDYWEGWEPIRAYLEQERLAMGWDVPTMKRLVGHSDLSRDHWTSKSQWSFPTREVYEALQRAAREQAAQRHYDGFKRHYDEIKRHYDEIKRDYMATRAYFDNTHDLMTDVFQYARVKGEERQGHPTPKPLALVECIIMSSTPPQGVVYDGFLGSGTTLVACDNRQRVCYACDVKPCWVAVSLQRYADVTGDTPHLVEV